MDTPGEFKIADEAWNNIKTVPELKAYLHKHNIDREKIPDDTWEDLLVMLSSNSDEQPGTWGRNELQ